MFFSSPEESSPVAANSATQSLGLTSFGRSDTTTQDHLSSPGVKQGSWNGLGAFGGKRQRSSNNGSEAVSPATPSGAPLHNKLSRHDDERFVSFFCTYNLEIRVFMGWWSSGFFESFPVCFVKFEEKVFRSNLMSSLVFMQDWARAVEERKQFIIGK